MPFSFVSRLPVCIFNDQKKDTFYCGRQEEGKEENSKRELKYVSLCKILAGSMLEEKTS